MTDPADMTPEQVRVEIAEWCGLKPVTCPFAPNRHTPGHKGDWFTPDAAELMRKTYPHGAAPKVIPDYCNDLNAMWEAEEKLDKISGQLEQYRHLLSLEAFKASTYTWHAKADTRAIAFVRVIRG